MMHGIWIRYSVRIKKYVVEMVTWAWIGQRNNLNPFYFFSYQKCTSIGFHGNAVTLWERLYKEHQDTGELLVDLGSDQTSCHDPFGGGYYPVQLGFDEANQANKIISKQRNQKYYYISRLTENTVFFKCVQIAFSAPQCTIL